MISAEFELLESLFNIDYVGVHIPLEQVFSVRQVLKHKPFSIRPAYFHSCVPFHYLIFVGRGESEARSVCVVMQWRVGEATARSATGSCPRLAVFCAVAPVSKSAASVCENFSVTGGYA